MSLLTRKLTDPSLSDWYKEFTEFIFLYVYIKSVNSDKGLGLSNYSISPQWKKNSKELDKKNTKKRKRQLRDIEKYSGEFFFMTKKKTYLLSFLCHLRNAIAHGEIKFVHEYVEIRDYGINKQGRINRTPTAYCKIEKNNLRLLFNKIIQ